MCDVEDVEEEKMNYTDRKISYESVLRVNHASK